jgi:hypothetical protein
MEAVFLVCFVFGALFTTVSAVLGFAGSALHGEFGHGQLGHGDAQGAGVDAGQGQAHLGPHVPGHIHGNGLGHALGHALGHGHAHGHAPVHVPAHGHGTTDLAHDAQHASVVAPHTQLPLLNASSLLAFLTWFGASGYLLMHFAGWPALLAAPVSLVPGAAAGLLIAYFLGKVIAGQREMRPADYQLEGTIARVTVGIPASGVGEIVFSKAGTRRSEAARSLSGRAIPYDTEVVVIEYERGVALVQTWNEMLGRPEQEALTPGSSPLEDSA